jgi:hypothetical protein
LITLKRTVLVIDNPRAHKKSPARQAIETMRAILCQPPQYSLILRQPPLGARRSANGPPYIAMFRHYAQYRGNLNVARLAKCLSIGVLTTAPSRHLSRNCFAVDHCQMHVLPHDTC